MGNFQGGGSRGGGGFRGGDRGGRPSFGGKKPFGGPRSGGDRDTTMYKATCSECGTSCEVPFKPSGDKPVYCKNCFGAMRDSEGDRGARPSFESRGPKKSFGDRPSFRSNDRSDTRPAYTAAPDNGEMKKQLADIGTKLDKLINIVERVLDANMASVKKEAVKESVAKAVASDKPKAKVVKKKK